MKLKLGLGLPFADDDGAARGTIPPTTPPGGGGGGGSGGFEGHETPPTVEVVEDTVVIHGKTKAGFVGRIVVPLGALVAGRTYNVNVVANLSGLALGGAKAGIGFGFKTGNDFRMELLQGNAGSTRLATITGSPPTNGWNKNIGHTVQAHGAPTNGTQHAMDIQMVVNDDGDAYTFSTSGDDQETWDEELADQSLAPFADITEVESGAAIAAYFASDDFGTYVITVTWVEQDLAVPTTFMGVVAKYSADVTGVTPAGELGAGNWNAEDVDTHAFHLTAGNTHRITIPADANGMYGIFYCSMYFTNPGSNSGHLLALLKGGSLIFTAGPGINPRHNSDTQVGMICWASSPILLATGEIYTITYSTGGSGTIQAERSSFALEVLS